jgi:hypothetical protein
MSREPDYSKLPEHLRPGMRRYIENGILPGGFLLAVLSNDLSGAVMRADEVSLQNLRQICQWLLDEAPGFSFGSAENVKLWPAYAAASGQR